MTMQETSDRYKIPLHILEEYEGWELCGTGKKAAGRRQYDDSDLEWLSLIMTLYDIGFCTEEVEAYLRLALEEPQNGQARLQMLNRRRDDALDDLHCRERQLQRLDYLRHEIRKQK